MLIGVDDVANNNTHSDIDEFDVFAKLKGDAGCGNGEFFKVFNNARFARCNRWVADGHSAESQPLMPNTAQGHG